MMIRTIVYPFGHASHKRSTASSGQFGKTLTFVHPNLSLIQSGMPSQRLASLDILRGFDLFLLVFLQKGADEISTVFMLDQSFSDIITGIILFFIIGSEFFINYELKFRRNRKEAA